MSLTSSLLPRYPIPLGDASSWLLSLKQASVVAPPDMTGALEGAYAMPLPQVLACLSELISGKMLSSLAYTIYSTSMRGVMQGAVHEAFEERSIQEREMVEYYTRRASIMGGPPNLPDIPQPPPSSEPEEIVRILIRIEQDNIGKQRELRDMLGENVMKFKVEGYLGEDQDHLDALWSLLPQVENPAPLLGADGGVDAAPPAAEASAPPEAAGEGAPPAAAEAPPPAEAPAAETEEEEETEEVPPSSPAEKAPTKTAAAEDKPDHLKYLPHAAIPLGLAGVAGGAHLATSGHPIIGSALAGLGTGAAAYGGVLAGVGRGTREQIYNEVHDPRLYSNLRGAASLEGRDERVQAHTLLDKGRKDSVLDAMHEGFTRGSAHREKTAGDILKRAFDEMMGESTPAGTDMPAPADDEEGAQVQQWLAGEAEGRAAEEGNAVAFYQQQAQAAQAQLQGLQQQQAQTQQQLEQLSQQQEQAQAQISAAQQMGQTVAQSAMANLEAAHNTAAQAMQQTQTVQQQLLAQQQLGMQYKTETANLKGMVMQAVQQGDTPPQPPAPVSITPGAPPSPVAPPPGAADPAAAATGAPPPAPGAEAGGAPPAAAAESPVAPPPAAEGGAPPEKTAAAPPVGMMGRLAGGAAGALAFGGAAAAGAASAAPKAPAMRERISKLEASHDGSFLHALRLAGARGAYIPMEMAETNPGLVTAQGAMTGAMLGAGGAHELAALPENAKAVGGTILEMIRNRRGG